MKKYFFVCLSSIVVLFTSSCEKYDNPPVALFSMDKTTASVGETIIFTNLSVNAGAFIWYFGDGTIDPINRNTTYSYSSAGSYTVELLVMKKADSNSRKGADTATRTILITP